jgi:hypothetical protein
MTPDLKFLVRPPVLTFFQAVVAAFGAIGAERFAALAGNRADMPGTGV